MIKCQDNMIFFVFLFMRNKMIIRQWVSKGVIFYMDGFMCLLFADYKLKKQW